MGHIHDDGAEIRQGAVVQRIVVVAGLPEVLLGKGARIGDDQPAAMHVGQVDLERRGIHGDQDVDHVAGSLDGAGAEIDLIGGDPEGGPGWRPNLGREVRIGRQVVAFERGLHGEAAAGQLHAVAGVAGEADDG